MFSNRRTHRRSYTQHRGRFSLVRRFREAGTAPALLLIFWDRGWWWAHEAKGNRARSLSGGQQRRVCRALKALMQKSTSDFGADEPVTAPAGPRTVGLRCSGSLRRIAREDRRFRSCYVGLHRVPLSRCATATALLGSSTCRVLSVSASTAQLRCGCSRCTATTVRTQPMTNNNTTQTRRKDSVKNRSVLPCEACSARTGRPASRVREPSSVFIAALNLPLL